MFQNKINKLQLFEKLFTIVVFIYFTKAILHPYLLGFEITKFGEKSMEEESIILLRSINFTIYIIITFLLILRPYYRRKLKEVVGRQKLLFLFLGLVFLSALWSVNPAFTIRRFFALSGTTLFAFYVFLKFSAEEQLKLLSSTFAFLAACSLFMILFFPSIGINTVQNIGSWRGCFTHKIELGAAMSLGLLLILTWPKTLKRRKIESLWMAILYGMLLFKSNAVGSWIATIIPISIMPWMLIEWRNKYLVTATCIFLSFAVLFGGYIIFLYSDVLLSSVGREASLTGRVPFWQAALEDISVIKFLSGYGYDAFTNSLDNYKIRYSTGFWARGMHNGYLEVLFATGIIGLFTIVTILTKTGYALLRRIPLALQDFSGFATLLFVNILVVNTSESRLVRTNDLYWVLLVIFICYASDVKSKLSKRGFMRMRSSLF